MPSSSTIVQIVSKCRVYPESKSNVKSLKLSVSDLPMLSCQYIQKGVLLSEPPLEIDPLLALLKLSLARTLSHFPALAGRLRTQTDGHVHIICDDSGVLFVHARASLAAPCESLLGRGSDIPPCFRRFFQFDGTLSYAGHSRVLVAVQVTELNGGLFVGCTVNHAVVDGTSFWNFFNTFAEVCKFKGAAKKISKSPDFSRDTVFDSPVVLNFPAGGPSPTFSGDEPLREKIFHFSKEAILKLKYRANSRPGKLGSRDGKTNGRITLVTEMNGPETNRTKPSTDDISSFQSLCAQLWRSVTRARNLDDSKKTTFRMAVNCRPRVEPPMHPLYFGNAIQSIPTVAPAGELLSQDLKWCADLLHQNVVAHDESTVRRGISDWESNPRVFPLGNFDGAMITMGSSPRFPMYDNDFGWGRPLAVRSGKANKFDGKISAFPGREGNGSVDLEVVLAPQTMAGLENDTEFMQYVS